MKQRSTQVDLALAFSATFVITLAVWPARTPRQIVRCNLADQGWKTYSIAIDDPTLDALKKQVDRWTTPEEDPQYVTAKWQLEVAEFYENCKPCVPPQSASPKEGKDGPATATLSDNVTTASFEMPLDDQSPMVRQVGFEEPSEQSTSEQSTLQQSTVLNTADASAATPSDANYWATVKAAAAESMKRIERRSENVPVVFENVKRSSWPQLAFHLAFLFALTAACCYMHWLRLAPTRRGIPFRDQPIGVLGRIGTFTGINLLAIPCAIALWI